MSAVLVELVMIVLFIFFAFVGIRRVFWPDIKTILNLNKEASDGSPNPELLRKAY